MPQKSYIGLGSAGENGTLSKGLEVYIPQSNGAFKNGCANDAGLASGMDRTWFDQLRMHDDIRNQPLLLFFGSLIPLGLAIYGTVTGTAVLKNSKARRSDDPFEYWSTLIFEYGAFAWAMYYVVRKLGRVSTTFI